MRQSARVERLVGPREAVISVRRKGACASDCQSCKGCAHPEETLEVVAYNAAGALPGQQVVVETRSTQVLGLAALLYLMPVALLFLGYFAVPGGEGLKMAGAGLGLLAGLFICRRVSVGMRARGRMTLTIIAVEAGQQGFALGRDI